MSRHRAERLAAIAMSKGIEAKVYASASSRPGASSPYMYTIVLRKPQQPLPAWCYSTSHFFGTLRHLLSVQKACRP